MTKGTINFSILISALGLLVAGFSLLVTYVDFKQSESLRSKEQSLVLRGEFDADNESQCDDWIVKPISEGFSYQGGRAYLPPSIYREPILIDAEGVVHFNQGACAALLRYVAARTMSKKPGFVNVSPGELPLYLVSSYATKGDRYDDASLYSLHVISSAPFAGEGEPRILMDGLSMLERVPAGANLDMASLERLLAAKRPIYLPPKAP